MSTTKQRILVVVIFVITAAQTLLSQSQWIEQTRHMAAPSTAFRWGFPGFGNTAMMNGAESTELHITFTSGNQGSNLNQPSRWGLGLLSPSGFIPWSQALGVLNSQKNIADQSYRVTDVRYAIGFGDKFGGVSFGYGASFGAEREFARSSVGMLSFFTRGEYSTLGVTRMQSFGSAYSSENIVEFSIRPFKTPLLTLFAEIITNDRQQLFKSEYSLGGVMEVYSGFRLNIRASNGKLYGLSDNTPVFNVGTNISLGGIGLGYQQQSTFKNDNSNADWSVRIGGIDRSIFTPIISTPRMVRMAIRGGMKYQNFRLFDNAPTLLPTVEILRILRKDEGVKGLLLRCDGIAVNDEFMWEIHDELRKFKEAGKRLVIFTDRVDLSDYAFVSVADSLVLDPYGSISLNGYSSSRSFYNKALKKYGVGFDELRFFTYKSAVENYARDSMSQGDKIQRQRLLDLRFEQARQQILSNRTISAQRLDSIINSTLSILPDQALELGLVDALGRIDKATEVAQNTVPDAVLSSLNNVRSFAKTNDYSWGEKKSIAIIYAIGACAMDEGIKARTLVTDFQRAIDDKNIVAIVLRVDSPGGDPLASDILAEATIKAKKAGKPVIVSQGTVAASGGYWLSMYADTIVAAPNTITGSIGVISAWIYNNGLLDSLGITSSVLKTSKFSDINATVSVPLADFSLPRRSLSSQERSIREQEIKTLYKQFVREVANGRKMSERSIDSIAQGRVWMGVDGKANGLVDVLGGLSTAIDIACSKAGVARDDINYVEFPEPLLFDFSALLPSFLRSSVQTFDINSYISSPSNNTDILINSSRLSPLWKETSSPVSPSQYIKQILLYMNYNQTAASLPMDIIEEYFPASFNELQSAK